MDWPAVLEAFGVGVLILDRRADKGLLQQFRARSRWAEGFSNQDAVILVRIGHDVLESESTHEHVG